MLALKIITGLGKTFAGADTVSFPEGKESVRELVFLWWAFAPTANTSFDFVF